MDIYFYPHVGDLTKVAPMPLYYVKRIHNTKSEPARMPITDSDIDLSRRLKETRTAFKFQSWKVEDALNGVKTVSGGLNSATIYIG